MYQKVVLLGYTGKDVETRTTKTGTAIAAFSLATNKGYKNAAGEWVDTTNWHPCVIYGKLAESPYIAGITKGTLLLVEGEIATRTYKKRVGNTEIDIPAFEIRVTELRKASKPNSADRPAAGKGDSAAEAWDKLGVTDADLPF